MYENDVRRAAILGQYGTAVRSVRNCSENTNVYGVRPFTMTYGSMRLILATISPRDREKDKDSDRDCDCDFCFPAVVKNI